MGSPDSPGSGRAAKSASHGELLRLRLRVVGLHIFEELFPHRGSLASSFLLHNPRNLKKSQDIQHVNMCESCDIIPYHTYPYIIQQTRDIPRITDLPTFRRGMGSDCAGVFGRAEAVRGGIRYGSSQIRVPK